MKAIEDFYAINEVLIDGQKYIPLPKVKQIFCDIEPRSQNWDTDQVEEVLSFFGASRMILQQRNESTLIYNAEEIKVIEPLFKEFLSTKKQIALSKKIKNLVIKSFKEKK